MVICLPLSMQAMPWALILAFVKAGRSKAARMAIIAITTNNSISVKACLIGRRLAETVPLKWPSAPRASLGGTFIFISCGCMPASLIRALFILNHFTRSNLFRLKEDRRGDSSLPCFSTKVPLLGHQPEELAAGADCH